MDEREPVDTEFFPNPINFTTRHEHDTNKRKFYFVVPPLGIFTLLSDAMAWEPDQDLVTPALTMKQALGILDAHRKLPSIKREVKVEIKREELKREVSTPSPRKEKMLPLYADDDDDEEDEVLAASEDQSHASRRKRASNASQDSDVRERDGKDNNGATETASRKRSEGSVPASPRGSHAKRARAGRAPTVARSPPPARTPAAASVHLGATVARSPPPTRTPAAAPPPELSPTVSSVSSISTASSVPGLPASHPYRNLGESVSTARRGGGHAVTAHLQSPGARPSSSVPAARGSPARRGGSVATRAGSRPASAAVHDPTIHLGPGALRSFARRESMTYKPAALKALVEQRASASASASTSTSASGNAHADCELLLFNSATRTVYKDTYTAVQEMATKETVRVVGLDELAEYVSSGKPRDV